MPDSVFPFISGEKEIKEIEDLQVIKKVNSKNIVLKKVCFHFYDYLILASVDEQQDTQKYGVYNDVREPRKHAPSRNFDLPTYFFDNTEPTRLDKANNACKISCQVRLLSARPEIYDNCNRLNSPSSSPIYARVTKHDYDLTCIKSSRSLSESKLKDNNGSQYHKENNVGVINQYEEFRPTCMINRPYSSVKYDRKTTTNTND